MQNFGLSLVTSNYKLKKITNTAMVIVETHLYIQIFGVITVIGMVTS